MQQEPISLLEFQEKFATEQDCREHLEKMRWPEGFKCPRCNNKKAYYLENRKLYQCSEGDCKYQVSLTAGTIFHRSKMPLKKWFWMIYMMSQQKSVAILAIQKMLEINHYKTAWTMAHKIRQAMADRDSKYKLGGLLEIDDANFGHDGGSGAKRTRAIIAVEMKNNRPTFAVIDPVESVSILNVRKFAQEFIQAPCTVFSDGHRSYHTLNLGNSVHYPVVVGLPRNAHKLLPWVHTLLGNLKGWIRGVHHGIFTRHLKRYLAEFCYKFNRRIWQSQMFNRLLFACINGSILTFAELSP